MIQSKPNSNLLTEADRQFQHHLVSLVIYLYIYRQIQMVLDASTTKEESSAYNPVGGRIVLPTACEQDVRNFRFWAGSPMAKWEGQPPALFSDEFGPAPFNEPKLSVINGAGCQIAVYSSLACIVYSTKKNQAYSPWF
ncbi:MAG: hypothetical protein MH321_00950 [Leptospiraceae bacterium]|nr:hypothetical protein [Leptospiraceae bacterium]